MSQFTALKVKMTYLLLKLIVIEHVNTNDMTSETIVVVDIFFTLQLILF